jgi:hypothetical protein
MPNAAKKQREGVPCTCLQPVRGDLPDKVIESGRRSFKIVNREHNAAGGAECSLDKAPARDPQQAAVNDIHIMPNI